MRAALARVFRPTWDERLVPYVGDLPNLLDALAALRVGDLQLAPLRAASAAVPLSAPPRIDGHLGTSTREGEPAKLVAVRFTLTAAETAHYALDV